MDFLLSVLVLFFVFLCHDTNCLSLFGLGTRKSEPRKWTYLHAVARSAYSWEGLLSVRGTSLPVRVEGLEGSTAASTACHKVLDQYVLLCLSLHTPEKSLEGSEKSLNIVGTTGCVKTPMRSGGRGFILKNDIFLLLTDFYILTNTMQTETKSFTTSYGPWCQKVLKLFPTIWFDMSNQCAPGVAHVRVC